MYIIQILMEIDIFNIISGNCVNVKLLQSNPNNNLRTFTIKVFSCFFFKGKFLKFKWALYNGLLSIQSRIS